MECSNCGEPLDTGDTICPACGALSVTDDPVWQAATADEAPTEVIPIVRAEASDDGEESDGADDDLDRTAETVVPVAALAGTNATEPEPSPAADVTSGSPASDSAPALPSPAAAPRDPSRRTVWAAVRSRTRWSRPSLSRQTVVGALAGIAVVAILTATALVVGRVMNSPIAGGPSETHPATPVANGTPSSDATPNDPGQGYGCSAAELAAPATGRWRLYRAEFGPRDQYDYLRFNLRHQGGHDQAATVRVEVLPPGEVEGRYGIQGPSDADVALVVVFGDAIDIGGPWGGHPGYGALRNFQIARGAEGRVYAVVGVRGDGCFSLASGGWGDGQMNSQNDISLQIRKP